MITRTTIFSLFAACAMASPLFNFNSVTTNVVLGKAFDRYVTIFFENVDYSKAAGDPNFAWLAQQGIKLTNYHANYHPSQPNYWAAVAGDHFFWLDDFTHNLKGESTIVDLLEKQGISWSEYMEDMPVVGYTGEKYVNPTTKANMYVRKHNPLISFDSIYNNQQRLNQIKPLSMFPAELASGTLPQWMFISPNMTSDGHDSSVTTAGEWARRFLEPLLSDRRFMQRTLVLVTWDECENWLNFPNPVLGILLGDAVPAGMVGKEDGTRYDHYSGLSTVEANWNLGNLGRNDKGATVFANLGL